MWSVQQSMTKYLIFFAVMMLLMMVFSFIHLLLTIIAVGFGLDKVYVLDPNFKLLNFIDIFALAARLFLILAFLPVGLAVLAYQVFFNPIMYYAIQIYNSVVADGLNSLFSSKDAFGHITYLFYLGHATFVRQDTSQAMTYFVTLLNAIAAVAIPSSSGNIYLPDASNIIPTPSSAQRYYKFVKAIL